MTTVAQTIWTQLGAGRFSMMTGAKAEMALENGIQIKLKRNMSGANKMRVNLTADDLYTVEFWKVSAKTGACKVVVSADGLYADMLAPYFEKITGMYTTM